MTDSLFPELVPAEPEEDTRTPGERRRDGLAADIARGQHPLGRVLRAPLPLHPDAERVLRPAAGPTCGTCAHRRVVSHGNRSWPKCFIGYDPSKEGTRAWRPAPRDTSGQASDVPRYWPACHDYEEAP